MIDTTPVRDYGHFHDERCETSVRNGHVGMESNGEVVAFYTNGHFTPFIVEMSYDSTRAAVYSRKEVTVPG